MNKRVEIIKTDQLIYVSNSRKSERVCESSLVYKRSVGLYDGKDLWSDRGGNFYA